MSPGISTFQRRDVADIVPVLAIRLATRIAKSDDSIDRIRGPAKLTLPKANYAPTERSQREGVSEVLDPVAGDLGSPEVSVSTRRLVMLWAAMPEASVDEDRDFFSHDRDVWTRASNCLP